MISEEEKLIRRIKGSTLHKDLLHLSEIVIKGLEDDIVDSCRNASPEAFTKAQQIIGIESFIDKF